MITIKTIKKNIWIKSNTGEFININNIIYISNITCRHSNMDIYFKLCTKNDNTYHFSSKIKDDNTSEEFIKKFKDSYEFICDIIINEKYSDDIYYPFNNK